MIIKQVHTTERYQGIPVQKWELIPEVLMLMAAYQPFAADPDKPTLARRRSYDTSFFEDLEFILETLEPLEQQLQHSSSAEIFLQEFFGPPALVSVNLTISKLGKEGFLLELEKKGEESKELEEQIAEYIRVKRALSGWTTEVVFGAEDGKIDIDCEAIAEAIRWSLPSELWKNDIEQLVQNPGIGWTDSIALAGTASLVLPMTYRLELSKKKVTARLKIEVACKGFAVTYRQREVAKNACETLHNKLRVFLFV